ncbi:hypothetical protein [Christiangramia echinicola]|uniref:hypothetical protein n=1 Tax=Christiangramia echinicola TaxID=279359 RepID=UPI000418DDE8|nr:hypothetical protein [Christiangramia echinicola]
MSRLWILIAFFFVYQAKANPLNPGPITFPKAEILNENTARIPFKLIDHLIVVEAELYNKKGNFIIDTGSETLILNKVHFPNQYGQPEKFVKSSGVLDNANAYEKYLEEFILKNFSLKNTNSHVIDLSHIEKRKKMNLMGIIGYSILKDYEVFVDMHLNQITLSRIDKNGDKLDPRGYLEKITDSIEFKLQNHSIVVKTFVGEEKMNFALDSGAEFNQLNNQQSKKVLKYFVPSKRMVLVGASDKKAEVLAGKLYRVKLSDKVYFGPMNTIITNLNRMSEAFGVNLDGVLGYEFFAQKRTIINYRKEMLYFIDYPINFQN